MDNLKKKRWRYIEVFYSFLRNMKMEGKLYVMNRYRHGVDPKAGFNQRHCRFVVPPNYIFGV